MQLRIVCACAHVSVGMRRTHTGSVTGEASTWPRWVHLLPRWQVTWRGLTVAIANGQIEEDYLLVAIWRIMGEHLVPRGSWPLTKSLDWHKSRHIINVIISPGVVSMCVLAYSFILQLCAACICLLLLFQPLRPEAPTPSCCYHYSSYDWLYFSLCVFVHLMPLHTAAHNDCICLCCRRHVTRRNPTCGIG